MAESRVHFHEMGLDDRLLKAISKLGWTAPTLVQERTIPLALQGKDILARARTGSGKTAAYIIPIVQKILLGKHTSVTQEVKVLVLAPSRELCHQIYNNFLELTSSASREVRCIDVSVQVDFGAQRSLLVEKPDVVIGTPGRILGHMQVGNLNVKETLEVLVIDEADLMFAFGFEKDTKAVLGHLPSIYQAFLMSATLGKEVVSLKKLVLHNPVILKLEEPELPDASQLIQYHINCEEMEKFVVLYALFKLKLIRGRTIIFVSTVDRCYRIKLYLEQFGIPSCALNAELPINSRCHTVAQFNEGMYDIIVASDERNLEEALPSQEPSDNTKMKTRRKPDKNYGISRGLDFRSVSNVINFDFPPDVDSYIHRVGRTARNTNQGTALSFVKIKETPLMEDVKAFIAEKFGTEASSVFKPYQFKMEEIESFRYRANDALRSVTSIAIREARLKEIKHELLQSQRLKTYFEDNPRDYQILRHDRALHTIKVQSHLKDVPEYIVPPTLRKLIKSETPRSRKRKTKQNNKQEEPSNKRKRLTKEQRIFKKKQANPLKSFEFQGFKKQGT